MIEVVAVEIVHASGRSAPDAMNGLKILSSKKSWMDGVGLVGVVAADRSLARLRIVRTADT